MEPCTPIDISGRSIRMSRREVRELLKEVGVYCCGVGGSMSMRRTLSIVGKCVSERGEAPELEGLLDIDLKGRSLRFRRREVRELLKEIAKHCCGTAGPVTLNRSLSILEKCVSDPLEAPLLRALLEFARLQGQAGRNGEALQEPTPLGSRYLEEPWDAL
jgi:hypothetical protein